MTVPKEVQLRVADAKQRDVGHGKVRIDNENMLKLAISAGDFIDVHGKRMTVAIAWPAYAEDQGQEIVGMDGLLRRNAGVAVNEYITIKKAEVKDSQTIVFAPADVRLSVDEEFVEFVKRRFMNTPFVEGDMTLLSIFGSAVPLIATRTRPHGPIKITESTVIQVMSEPTPEKMNREVSSWRGFTIQVYVKDIKRALLWYERLIGRKPDSAPFPEFLEWEILSGFWFQVVEKKRIKVPRQNRRMRFGVSDIEKERTGVAERMKVKVTEVEGLTGIVKWCNFEDPWGNKLGLFQDLEKFP